MFRNRTTLAFGAPHRIFAALVAILACGLVALPQSTAQAVHRSKQSGTICGVLRFHQMSGADTIYVGTGYGTVTAVESEGGTVVAAMSFNVTPGAYFTLHPNQAWHCGQL